MAVLNCRRRLDDLAALPPRTSAPRRARLAGLEHPHSGRSARIVDWPFPSGLRASPDALRQATEPGEALVCARIEDARAPATRWLSTRKPPTMTGTPHTHIRASGKSPVELRELVLRAILPAIWCACQWRCSSKQVEPERSLSLGPRFRRRS